MTNKIVLITNDHGFQYRFCLAVFRERYGSDLVHFYFKSANVKSDLRSTIIRFLKYIESGLFIDFLKNFFSRLIFFNFFKDKQRAIDRLFGQLPEFEEPSQGVAQESEIVDQIGSLSVELIVVCGAPYLSEIPSLGVKSINLHLGTLPFYRGLKCIEHALLNKDYNKIGYSIHELTTRLDDGAILAADTIKADIGSSLASIYHRLYVEGIESLLTISFQMTSSNSLVISKRTNTSGHLYKSIMFNRYKMWRLRRIMPISGRILWIAGNPVQYHAPIYRFISETRLLTVCFLSDLGARPFYSAEQGGIIEWDVDILSGYESIFSRNMAPDSWKGAFSRICFEPFKLVCSPGYEVVVINGYSLAINWALIVLAKISGKSVYLRGETTKSRRHWAFRLLQVFLDGVCVSCAANSKALGSKFPDLKQVYIPSTVDYDFFKPKTPKEFERKELVFVVVSRLTERKNISRILSFVASCQVRLGRKFRLLICGDGPLKDVLVNETNDLDVNAEFLGFVGQNGVRDALERSDIFLNFSHYDASPKALNEAMAMGIPLMIAGGVGQSLDLVDCSGCYIFDDIERDFSPEAFAFVERVMEPKNAAIMKIDILRISERFKVERMELEALI